MKGGKNITEKNLIRNVDFSSKDKKTLTHLLVIILLIIDSNFFNGFVHHVLAVLIDTLLFSHPRVLHLDHRVSAVLSSSSALSLQKTRVNGKQPLLL